MYFICMILYIEILVISLSFIIFVTQYSYQYFIKYKIVYLKIIILNTSVIRKINLKVNYTYKNNENIYIYFIHLIYWIVNFYIFICTKFKCTKMYKSYTWYKKTYSHDIKKIFNMYYDIWSIRQVFL